MTKRTFITALPATLLAVGASLATAQDAPSQPTLKDAFREHFKIGTCINRGVATGQGFRRTPEQVAADVALVKAQFNHIVAENEMKWASLHPRPGEDGYDFTAADAFVKFGTDNGMELAGHTLVWHSQTPNWVFEGTHLPPGAKEQAPPAEPEAEAPPPPNPDSPPRRRFGPGGGPGGFRPFNLDGPRASREELLERMRQHIHTVMGRYKGKIKVWDVVNEALADNGDEVLRKSPWSVIIGPDFVEKAFLFAHEADPDALLRYNDYGLENPAKRAKLIKLIKELQEKKVPVHVIGSQAHVNVNTTFEIMDQSLAEMKTLGLPIHITELDVNGAMGGQQGFGADIGGNASATDGGLVEEADRKLTAAYTGIFKAFLKHTDALNTVVFWGPNDANSWRSRGRPLLFDADSKPKPAFDAVIKLATGGTAAAPKTESSPAPAGGKRHVFLCFGQSNMEGFPGIEDQDKGPVDGRFEMLAAVDFPKHNRIQGRWYPAVPPLSRENAGLGPADYFGRTLLASLPQDARVGIVNVSIGGCKIELFQKGSFQSYADTAPPWMKGAIAAYGGNPYQRLVDMAKLAQQEGEIRGILLHQGESNNGDREWPAKVKGIYESLLADLNLKAEDVPLLAGELLSEEENGACASMNSIIGELPKVIPTAHVVSSKGCAGLPDRLHFSPAGYRELGRQYAAVMRPLLAPPATGQR
jgi:GH35 family endo-1,4-beta-xylanase